MRKLYRNIALVTLVFMLALSAMLLVSYYQMQQVSPLQSEVLETLKSLNESNGDNAVLQQQIRELDLISRKAYFVQEGQLNMGIYILLGMALVLVLSANMYYRNSMNLPDKDVDSIDEWMNKSRTRHYLSWGAGIAAFLALGFVAFQRIDFSFSNNNAEEDTNGNSLEAIAIDGDNVKEAEQSLVVPDETVPTETSLAVNDASDAATISATSEVKEKEVVASETVSSEVTELPIPKITSKAFRGNNSSGSSSARGIATSWDLKSKKNILWRSSIPKHGYNSPVIVGRNVFITGADADARQLYCYDIYTGELHWQLDADNIAGSPSTMPSVNDDTGLAASTVAANDKVVCAIFATGDVICADHEGHRLWAKNLGLPDNHYGYASSLLIYGNALIVQYQNNSNAQILALNTTDGSQLWKKTAKDRIAWSSPIIATIGGKPALIVMGNPAVAAYNPSTGAELWRMECLSGEVGSSPVSSDGVVYAASEYSKCVAINGSTGELVWESSDYLPECSSLAATTQYLICATSYGMVCAYDVKTGEVKVEHDLSTPFYSSPMVVDGKVYLFSNTGMAYIFSASDFSLITKFDTGEKTFATPAFSDQMMVVRTDNSLYCVKK